MSDTAGSSSDGTVDRLLRDAGLGDDALLRDALQDLRGLADGRPEASAAVAALMVPAATRHLAAVPEFASQTGGPTPPAQSPAPTLMLAATPAAATPPATDELAARRRAKRRITLTTLSVAVSLAAGGAVAVASDQGLRDSMGQVTQAVSSFVATAGGGSTPVPPVRPATPAPPPAQPASPATVPAAPPVAQPGTAAPGSKPGQALKHAPGQPSPAPAAPLPDLPVPGKLAPSLPGVPGRLPNGEGQPPALPLPATPPVQLPAVRP